MLSRQSSGHVLRRLQLPLRLNRDGASLPLRRGMTLRSSGSITTSELAERKFDAALVLLHDLEGAGDEGKSHEGESAEGVDGQVGKMRGDEQCQRRRITFYFVLRVSQDGG